MKVCTDCGRRHFRPKAERCLSCAEERNRVMSRERERRRVRRREPAGAAHKADLPQRVIEAKLNYLRLSPWERVLQMEQEAKREPAA